MAIKGGQIIHAGNGAVVIDRIQTGGPGQLNIPTEKIYELGNYKSVATIRDTPDLTFTWESFDTTLEGEAFLASAYQGRSVANAVTTAADATVSSASAAFTSADVGRAVVITDADTDTDFTSNILSVTNGTTVELDDVVPTTNTGATLEIAAASINPANAVPVDIASQFKAGLSARPVETAPFAVTASIAVPFLYLESLSYKFGLRDNATQSASLKGDTIFYNPGPTLIEETAGSGVAGQVVATAQAAYQVAEDDERRVLAVTVGTQRLTFGVDYAESYGSITAGAAVTTITVTDAVAITDTVRLVYATSAAVSYPQNVHPDTVLKPAAVKGRDIDIYVGGYDPSDPVGSLANKLTSVQSVSLDWKVTVEKDEEFGNHYAVGQDFDVPTVSGSVDIKPRDPDELHELVAKVQGITDLTKVLGTATSVPLELDIVIKHPDTGKVVKRLHVEDARFTPPGMTGRVQQKTTVTLPFESDEGELLLFRR